MAETLDPAPDEFVIHVSGSVDEAITQARKLGSLKKIDDAEGLYVLRVQGSKSSKQAWQVAARELGEGTPLFPVLYDRNGTPHYPTGEVTVRFDAVPSDAELRRFGAAQHLRLLRKNEYAAQQVVYEPAAAASEYLPELVTRLAELPGVRSAWANTLSRFRRADR